MRISSAAADRAVAGSRRQTPSRQCAMPATSCHPVGHLHRGPCRRRNCAPAESDCRRCRCASYAQAFRRVWRYAHPRGRDLGIASRTHAMKTVLIVDVILAGSTTGIELCERAIERHPGIAIVVITADNEVRGDEIPKRGIFVRKPFGAEQLLEAIDAALERTRADRHERTRAR